MYALTTFLTNNQPDLLPMTGGDGPMIVTIAGLSMAGLSLVLLFLLSRKGKKPKGKAKGNQRA